MSLLRKNFDNGPAYLAEKVFPAKSRGPINILQQKRIIERATKRLASGKVNQKLDYDAIFAGYEEKFREAVVVPAIFSSDVEAIVLPRDLHFFDDTVGNVFSVNIMWRNVTRVCSDACIN